MTRRGDCCAGRTPYSDVYLADDREGAERNRDGGRCGVDHECGCGDWLWAAGGRGAFAGAAGYQGRKAEGDRDGQYAAADPRHRSGLHDRESNMCMERHVSCSPASEFPDEDHTAPAGSVVALQCRRKPKPRSSWARRSPMYGSPTGRRRCGPRSRRDAMAVSRRTICSPMMAPGRCRTREHRHRAGRADGPSIRSPLRSRRSRLGRAVRCVRAHHRSGSRIRTFGWRRCTPAGPSRERDCGVVEVQQRVHVQVDLDWLEGGYLRPVDHAPGRDVRPGIRFRDGGFGECGLARALSRTRRPR